MKFVADCEGMVGDTSPSRLSKKKRGIYGRAQYYSHIQENSFIKQCPLHLFVVWVS